jgi:hypothetical protein
MAILRELLKWNTECRITRVSRAELGGVNRRNPQLLLLDAEGGAFAKDISVVA